MSRFTALIGEIHRRSLWQVLGIYLVTSWFILQIVDTLAGALNLPDWAPSLALFLLIVGLPIVLATAFVQGGFGPGDAGAGPAAGTLDQEILPEAGRAASVRDRFFTWRNAIAGGILAFAGWGVAAAAWLLLGPLGAGASLEREGPPFVAVLPFANESAAGGDDAAFFSSGIHDEVITRLSKVGGLKVISRASVMFYEPGVRDLGEIADELGVGALVEGGVQRAGDLVRMNVQLIEPETGESLWAERYENDLTTENIFAIQADIALQISNALEAELTPQEAALVDDRPTNDLEAYEFFLRGTERFDERYTEDDLRHSQQMFEEAVRLDPGFAVAWARLARTHAQLYWFYDRSPARAQAATETIERALALDRDHPATRLAAAEYHYHIELDYESALRELDLAREQAPNDVFVVANIAFIQRRMGLWELATENMQRALELDPNSARTMLNLAISYQWLQQDVLAQESISRTLELSPDWTRAIAYRAMFFLFDDDGTEALNHLRAAEAAGLRPMDDPLLALAWVRSLGHDLRFEELIAKVESQSWGTVEGQFSYLPDRLLKAQAYGGMGDSEAASREYQAAALILEGALETDPADERIRSALALAYAGLGRDDEAVREAEHAVELMPRSSDPIRSYYRLEDLARVHAAVGNNAQAVQLFDDLLTGAGYLTARFLRADPTLVGLRENPDFVEMLDRH